MPSALLLVFLLNLLLRGDGHFPFSKSVNPALFGAVVLFQTLVLVAVAVGLAVLVVRGLPPGRQGGMGETAQLVVTGSSIAFIAVLHVLNARRFAEFGYASRPVLLSALVAAACLALIALWRRHRFAGILLADLLLKLYPLICFPIAAQRSDMLPVIGEAARALSAGENIYRYYLLDTGAWTPMARFPALVMTYAPAAILGLDLRVVTLVCETLFFVLLARRFGRNPMFAPGVILLALSPYWHFRHDLYEAPFWVALVVLLLAIERRNSPVEFAALAIVVCMHQWGVLFVPFVGLLLARSRSWRYGLAATASALAVGVLVVNAVSRGDLASFWQQTIVYWSAKLASWAGQGDFPRTSLYLTPWLAAVGGAAAVKAAGAGLVAGVLGWAFFRLRSLAQLAGFLALVLVVVLLTNTVAWTYQYLLVGALLWIGLMLDTERGPGATGGSPRPD